MPRVSDEDKERVRRLAREAAKRAGENEAETARTAAEIEREIRELEQR